MSVVDLDAVRKIAASVDDPELPHVTIGDLGMVRSVTRPGERVLVTLTPTYTGCPATEEILADVRAALADAHIDAEVEMVMSPAWTTDWITDVGREKLRAVGIAPPAPAGDQPTVMLDLPVACPRCGSRRTQRISDFGATACKAPYRCNACQEPFESFKSL